MRKFPVLCLCYQWPVLGCHGTCGVVIRAHTLRGDKGIEKEDAPGGCTLKGRQVGIWEGGFPGRLRQGYAFSWTLVCIRCRSTFSVVRPSCCGSRFDLIPQDIFNDGSSAARLAMSRAPLDFGICSADVFVLHVL